MVFRNTQLRANAQLRTRNPLKAKASLRTRQTKISVSPRSKRKYIPFDKKNAQQLISTADQYFSKYVRLRDSTRVNNEWFGRCITCSRSGRVAWIDLQGDKPKIRFDKDWDAGHYVSRGVKVIRYHEQNVNLQCGFRCNRMRSGEHEKYRLALVDKYGHGTPDKLEQIARTNPIYTLKKAELLVIIEEARKQLKFYITNE